MRSLALPPNAPEKGAIASGERLVDLNPSLADEIVTRLVEAIPSLLSVVLFGSRARLDSRPDSDIDLYLIVDDEGPSGWDVMATANVALWDLGHPKDVIAHRLREYRELASQLGSLEYNVAREGVALYARP